MGHAFVVPFEYVLEERQIPIVPLFVNVDVRRRRNPIEPISLVAPSRRLSPSAGADSHSRQWGMSHYPGTEKYGNPDFDFDQYLLQVIERGELSLLLSLTSEKLDEAAKPSCSPGIRCSAPSGNTRGQVLSYQPTWHHGLGVIDFPLVTPLEVAPPLGPLPRRRHFVRATATTNFPSRSLTISIDCSTLCG